MAFYIVPDVFDYAFLNIPQQFTKAQGTDIEVLVDQTTISADGDGSNIFQVTLGGNRTLTATNLRAGGYTFLVYQDGAGSRTLAYDSMFFFPGDTTPVLQTDPNSLDIISCVSDGTNLYCSYISEPDFTLPSNVAFIDTAQTFSANQTFSTELTTTSRFKQTTDTLTDQATISADLSTGNIFEVTLGGNRTLTATNIDDGTYYFIIKQDGTGTRTLSYDTMFDFMGLSDPVLQTVGGSVDHLMCVGDGSSLRCVLENRVFLESLPGNVALKDAAQQFTATQGSTPVVESFAATITTDLSSRNYFETTLTGDSTWQFSNGTDGTFLFLVRQDGVGGRTLTLGTNIVLGDNNTLNTDPSAVNLYSCVYNSNDGKLRCTTAPFSS